MAGLHYPGLTALVAAALAFAAGELAGLRFGAPSSSSALLLPSVLLVALWLWPRVAGSAGSLALMLAAFSSVGFALGAAGREAARLDCRAAIPDGATVVAEGLLAAQPAADGAASVWLQRLGAPGASGARCTGSLRVRLARRGVSADAPRAGDAVRVVGRWWAWPVEGAWPRDGDRTGVLVADSLASTGPGQGLRAAAFRLRGSAQLRLRGSFGDRAAMAEALLLARADGVDPELRDRFVQSGLVHLLAISGTHVALIAGTLLLLARVARLGPRSAALAVGGATLAYVLFLGAPHAAARAGLQVLLLLVATVSQRPSNPFAPLSAAGLALLAADPLALLEPGFQLSFGGVAGIVAFRRRLLDSALTGGPRWLRDSLATNLAASATTAPLAALHFGQIAPVGLVSNLVAVPLMSLAVPAVALALLAGLVSARAGHFLAGAGVVFLDALDRVAALAAAVPGGNGYVDRDTVLAWTTAAVLTGVLGRRLGARFRPPVRRALAAAAGVSLLLVWPVVAGTRDRGALEIHAIDVGQGDAYAIRSPGGRWILVDAGPRSATFDAGRARVVPYLLRQGVKRLEAVILTHPDADHIGGAAAVFDVFPVASVVDPAHVTGKPLFLEVIGGAREGGVRWLEADAGRELRFDGVVLQFLAPDSTMLDVGNAANDLSVVFRLSYGRFAALFMGDAPAAVERHLVQTHGEDLRAQLLKVGHHGSHTSTDPELLAVAEPEIALISVGRQNRYGHPAPVVVDRLAAAGVRVLRTDLHGAIRIRVEADGQLVASTARSAE